MNNKEQITEAVTEYVTSVMRALDGEKLEEKVRLATFGLTLSIDSIIGADFDSARKQKRKKSPRKKYKKRSLPSIKHYRQYWIDEVKFFEERMLELSRDGFTPEEVANKLGSGSTYTRNVIRYSQKQCMYEDEKVKDKIVNEYVTTLDNASKIAARLKMSLYNVKKIIYMDRWDEVLDKLTV